MADSEAESGSKLTQIIALLLKLTHYRNVDRVLASSGDPRSLAEALEDAGLLALDGRRKGDGLWHAEFEAPEELDAPEVAVGRLLAGVRALAAARQALLGCAARDRRRNERGGVAFASGHTIGPAALAGTAASLRTTVYRRDHTPAPRP